jgi:hypothetical protein
MDMDRTALFCVTNHNAALTLNMSLFIRTLVALP